MIDKLERFRTVVAAKAKIELAVLDAMLLVFDEDTADKLVLRADDSYMHETIDALREAVNDAYLNRPRNGKLPEDKAAVEAKP